MFLGGDGRCLAAPPCVSDESELLGGPGGVSPSCAAARREESASMLSVRVGALALRISRFHQASLDKVD
jgi:hypothetical protein